MNHRMTQKKPIIAIVCHRGEVPGPGRVLPDSIGTTYITAIVKAGGLPFCIPLDFPLEDLSVIREICDGLFLTGGGDIETKRYNGVEHPAVEDVWPIRDEIESRLYHLALETDWPVFGICRGMQIMNVAAGGKLYPQTYMCLQEPLNSRSTKYSQPSTSGNSSKNIHTSFGSVSGYISR